ncbi:conserved hypothetical protein; putative exported protein [Herminiimonas arsenicoxydans]|uniref:Uncharacterized protein n=1 Tax=Herminiimonas arsenicoxydans TaxID=204773 RepID=A4G4C6_HERAR|nr:conserved hypothetical protein; putative exported protein [Herminiimonas arsenicoxydans]
MKFLHKVSIAILLATMGMLAANAAEREERVVYHINDSEVATRALNNIRNHLSASPKAKIVVVTHGAGIDFLLEGAKNKNGNPYDATVEELSMRHNVEFRVCNNTLTDRKIDKSKVLPEATIVPSGVAEVARLQIREGYAYLKP